MFSGLVRQIGKVRFYQNQILCINSHLSPNLGDSIAVNGACFTAIESNQDYFCVEISKESESNIAIENLKGFVHIEPALKLQDGLHGHIVQGHIDSIGLITQITQQDNQYIFQIQTDTKTLGLMVTKGSVCIDGISLTISCVYENSFKLVIIPHTMQNTLFHSYKIGRRVNIETDIIIRGIAHVVEKYIYTKLDSCGQKNILTQEILDSIALGY